MERSSSSDASSWNRNYGQSSSGKMCHCNRPSTVVKSWTDENPGRRFYKCDAHGFFGWVDEDKPHGWQKVSLLEARDQIRNLKDELRRLKESLRTSTQQNQQTGSQIVSVDSKMVEKLEVEKKALEAVNKTLEAEKKALENASITSKERENLLRQFVVISWGGFIVVTAMILTLGKN